VITSLDLGTLFHIKVCVIDLIGDSALIEGLHDSSA